MSSQMRLFDSQPVEVFRLKFSDIEIDDDDAEEFLADAELVLVVKVSVAGASLKRLLSGDWQRTNAASVSMMRVATGAMRNQLVEFYGLADDQMSLPLDVSSLTGGRPTTSSAAPNASTGVDPIRGADIATGEVLTPGQDFLRNGSGVHRGGEPASAHDSALASFIQETA